jgi:WD40 repeat protein
VATASSDGSARVFDAATGTERARLDHDDMVTAVAFAPDSTRVATASFDGSARVFDAATGTERARLDHDDAVAAVAFAPDGTRVTTASHDRSARVFDAATGTERARLDHDDAVYAVAFAPDGTRVATASDWSAQVFEVTADLLLARVLDTMTRPLNEAERRRYSLSDECRHVQLWYQRTQERDADSATEDPWDWR